MDLRKLSLTYVVIYLALGGAGFLLAPGLARDLLLSNREYEDVGFRVAGMMMLALAYLVWSIVRHGDWHLYPVSIHARAFIVIVLIWLLADTEDPMFLTLTIIVLIGLLPSIWVHYIRDRRAT